MAQIIEVPGMGMVEFPDGMSDDQIATAIKANMPQPATKEAVQAPAAKRSGFDSLARQIGLTGRYALEGVGQAADVVSEPVNGLARWAGVGAMAPSQTAGRLADSIGLPKPQGAWENIIGDATKMGFGAAAPAGVAGKLFPAATGAAGKALLAGLADNVAAQIGGGVGSGAASAVAREADVAPAGQIAAGLVGGVAGGMAGDKMMRVGQALGEPLGRLARLDPLPKQLTPKAMDNAQLASTLRNRLSITGGDWEAIPDGVRQSILRDVRKANSLENLDTRALQRLADFRALAVTPTRGTVTLDPVQLTREKNLAKSGANSRLGSAHGLARVESDNNAQLVRLMQQMEGGASVEPVQAGRMLSGGITSQRDALRSAEQAAWDAAKASPGYRMPMQAHVLGDVNAALGEAGMMPFMDGRISAYMQALQQSPDQFTPQAYRNLQSMLSKAMSAGGNEAAAAGIARRVLENAEMRPAATQIPNPGNLPATAQAAETMRATDPMPGNAMGAIDEARRATRSAYAFEDSSPLVRKVLSEGAMADPTRLGKHLLSATPDEAREIARHLGPQGMQTMRGAIATHIKQKALSGASDEVGNVSQKALNSAINAMGREKLGLFFSPDDVQQLERMGRVASYTQVQPAASAVNNSNSGALVVGKGIDLLTGITSKIPLLNIDQQVDALTTSLWRNPQAMNATAGLFPKPAHQGSLLGNGRAGLGAAGLLATPSLSPAENHKKRKDDHRK